MVKRAMRFMVMFVEVLRLMQALDKARDERDRLQGHKGENV